MGWSEYVICVVVYIGLVHGRVYIQDLNAMTAPVACPDHAYGQRLEISAIFSALDSAPDCKCKVTMSSECNSELSYLSMTTSDNQSPSDNRSPCYMKHRENCENSSDNLPEICNTDQVTWTSMDVYVSKTKFQVSATDMEQQIHPFQFDEAGPMHVTLSSGGIRDDLSHPNMHLHCTEMVEPDTKVTNEPKVLIDDGGIKENGVADDEIGIHNFPDAILPEEEAESKEAQSEEEEGEGEAASNPDGTMIIVLAALPASLVVMGTVLIVVCCRKKRPNTKKDGDQKNSKADDERSICSFSTISHASWKNDDDCAVNIQDIGGMKKMPVLDHQTSLDSNYESPDFVTVHQNMNASNNNKDGYKIDQESGECTAVDSAGYEKPVMYDNVMITNPYTGLDTSVDGQYVTVGMAQVPAPKHADSSDPQNQMGSDHKNPTHLSNEGKYDNNSMNGLDIETSSQDTLDTGYQSDTKSIDAADPVYAVVNKKKPHEIVPDNKAVESDCDTGSKTEASKNSVVDDESDSFAPVEQHMDRVEDDEGVVVRENSMYGV